ncbi:MAG TPA: response regulator transcription factor [Acidimicrobiales bacterium]
MSESSSGEPGETVRVLIVDDHPMFRMGLASALAEMDGIELVGEAERAGDVLALVEAARPDVVLLDVRLPDGSGLEVNRALAEHHPDVKVILLTMSEDHETVLTALRDGARGYLVKGTGPERVEHALRAVAGGDVVLNQDVALAVTELAQVRSRATRNRPFPALTDRELDILELIAQGLDNQTIARRLVLNPKTVRNHVSNVLTKVHATDRSNAIVLARQAGLGGESA